MKSEIDIQIYETDDGKCPYLKWESRLSRIARAKISARLERVKLGNIGDCKAIKGAKGLYELRIHYGPGYRIYFGKKGNTIILLLLGGSKSDQKKDIQRSLKLWEDCFDKHK